MKHNALAFLLHDTARLMRRHFDARAEATGVTRAQWHAMWELSHHQGCNQAVLADKLEVEPITLCRMVDRLQLAGLVERRADPCDRRAWRLHLTDAAQPLMAQAAQIGGGVLIDALAGVDDEAAEWAIETLTTMRANLARLAIK